MTRQGIALLVILPVLAACTQKGPTAPDASAGVLADDAGSASTAGSRARPFDGRCDTTITPLAPLPADPPNLLRLHIDYVCQLSHLGRTTASNEQTVTVTSPTTGTSENRTTYTAANGDQLFSTWTGTATFSGPGGTDVAFSGPETYIDGTGRFDGATGSSFISGTGSLATGTAHFTLTGTLSY